MSSTYTSNQKGAIATLFGAALWALSSLGITIVMGLHPASALMVFAIMVLVVWILIPLYLKKIKPAYIVGIIVVVMGLITLVASPGTPPWYTFTNPVSVAKELLFVLDTLACIYFSYKSYREL